MKTIRCAVYTRKSSEEGLEQDFNSLDAQHAACSAYITSQASEGWSRVGSRYEDGGISGGTLQRPGLQRLLDDIRSGLIDIVVVYKVDRLTRSLLDFSKLVETFDQAGVSFVSVISRSTPPTAWAGSPSTCGGRSPRLNARSPPSAAATRSLPPSNAACE